MESCFFIIWNDYWNIDVYIQSIKYERRAPRMVNGAKSNESVTECTKYGAQRIEHGARSTEYGARSMKHGARSIEQGT